MPRLFDTRGFLIASFNVLGASHTARSTRYATGNTRLNRAMTMLNARQHRRGRHPGVPGDAVRLLGRARATTRPGAPTTGTPPARSADTENAIIWRKSTMEFVSGETFDIPYFNGNIRHVPAVLLREKSSGRTAYFMNVHNPANTRGDAGRLPRPGHRHREAEDDRPARHRPSGVPHRRLQRPPEGVLPADAEQAVDLAEQHPVDGLRLPQADARSTGSSRPGQARFSSFGRDTYPQRARISDHPIVQTRAHLQD